MKTPLYTYASLLMLTLTICITPAYSQWSMDDLPDSEWKLKRMAEQLIEQANFEKALYCYLKLDSITEGKDPVYKYHTGIFYLQTHVNKQKAAPYLEAIWKDRTKFGADYYYYLGKAYHVAYRFDTAIAMYNTFLEEAKHRNERRNEVARAIEMCFNAKELVQDTTKVKIENLGPVINTAFSEYAPVISTDEAVLIFTSMRPGSIGGLQTPHGEQDTLLGKYNEDIYVSINVEGKWLKPTSIGRRINAEGHDAVIGLAPDGSQLFIYRSDTVRWGNIFSCSLEGYEWGQPKKLPAPVNSNYWEGSASITADGNMLYFSSNRPGGEGERDIYRSRRLPNGHWAAPENLGPAINTPYHDIISFIHPDGKTLYFSSQGHNSMGGYDIFRTQWDKDKQLWSKPVNLGIPVNTPDDDIYFILSADGRRGYFSSSRPGGYGNQDVYMAHLPAEVEALTLLKGFIRSSCKAQNMNNANIRINEYDNLSGTTGELVALNRPSSITGKYLIILEKGKDYRVRIEAPEHASQEMMLSPPADEAYVEIDTNFVLTCLEDRDTIIADTLIDEDVSQQLDLKLLNIYFYLDKADLTEAAIEQLDSVTLFMKKHPELEVFIQGHTDLIRTSEYNIRLSVRRADTVRNYLVEQGISATRLHIIKHDTQKPAPPDMKQAPSERSINRRVELMIIPDKEE